MAGEPESNGAEALPVTYRETTKRYAGSETAAVESLSLEVAAGEICVLVGPSGCGKTTAMRMVNRMVEITDGDILVGDRSVRDRTPFELRREIGYVIQQIGLFPHRTIGENIATVPRMLGWDKAQTEERVDELVGLIGLDPELRERYPAQLSGGQQQRVGVARALAANPGVMLMDEPFGAVDPINRERLQNEFLRLQAEVKKTILFVTHDIDEAIKMGDRIAVLQEGGKLAQYATPAELLMAPANAFVEDFVGADRALKRLALMRVSDVDLWEAPLAFVGQATDEVRAKLEGAEVPYALLVDSDRKPLGWLSETDLQKDIVPNVADSSPDPILDSSDVMRDALSDLLQAESHYAPVVDGSGVITGVLSIEIVGDFLSSYEATEDEHSGGRAAFRRMMILTLIGQSLADKLAGDSSDQCIQDNGAFCFNWIAENFSDRYVTPTLEHLYLVGFSVILGFVLAMGMAVLSHRRRWLVPPFIGFTGILYTIPSVAFFFLLLPITGRGVDTALIALTAYNIQIIYRNIVAGLNNVPAGPKDAGRGMGMTGRQLLWKVEFPLGGSRDRGRAFGSRRSRRWRSRRSLTSRAAVGSAARSSPAPTSPSRRTSWW